MIVWINQFVLDCHDVCPKGYGLGHNPSFILLHLTVRDEGAKPGGYGHHEVQCACTYNMLHVYTIGVCT